MTEITVRKDELKELIFRLCALPTVSGTPDGGSKGIIEAVGSLFDEVQTDAIGNCILIRRCGQADAPRILVDAHMDEIGMMVREVCEGGFIRLAPIGGIDPAVLQSADICVYGKKTMRGVISSTPPHLRSGSEDKLPEVADVIADVGQGYTKDELEELIPPGTPVGFAPIYRTLAGDRIVGKSFDDKACAACAVYAVAACKREELAGDVFVLLSRYEETSRLGGVATAIAAICPDYAMAVDVNLGKVDGAPAYETVEMEAGISITLSSAVDGALTREVRALCDGEQIPYSLSVAPSYTGTNATTFQLVAGSVPVVDIGLPLQSMHTPCEVISLQDCESLVRLIGAFVCSRELAASCAEKEEVLK
ncbi:MAG: M20/M25/M40 family metallo-hydrolase [Clostridia bacterium]|nr:M20/M25/M40 family metallo-hydrolase [Clostridia bacterium]